MKASSLKAIWEAPDNSRLMKKQTSVRLATHIGARVAALCEIYPAKSKSQIINDLLSAALDEFESTFEFVPGKELGADEKGRVYAEDDGARVSYINRANQFLREYEKEIGNNEPVLLDAVWVDFVK